MQPLKKFNIFQILSQDSDSGLANLRRNIAFLDSNKIVQNLCFTCLEKKQGVIQNPFRDYMAKKGIFLQPRSGQLLWVSLLFRRRLAFLTMLTSNSECHATIQVLLDNLRIFESFSNIFQIFLMHCNCKAVRFQVNVGFFLVFCDHLF